LLRAWPRTTENSIQAARCGAERYSSSISRGRER
jgi:hypothetical protein